jgi:hypothetical protein
MTVQRFYAEDAGLYATVCDRKQVFGDKFGVLAKCPDIEIAQVIANRLNDSPPKLSQDVLR